MNRTHHARSRRTVTGALIATLAGVTCIAATVQSPRADTTANSQSGEALTEAMREGGKVIFIRHATTERDYADQVTAVMGQCSTQRVLSEEGWLEAKAIGDAFAKLDIPVGAVYSSEYCRAWQTADLAFGRYEKKSDFNFAPAESYSDEQVSAMKAAFLPHLTAIPADGTNTVIVGHDDPFEAATGIYPEPMGVTYVLEPDGDGAFTILGKIEPDALQKIAKR